MKNGVCSISVVLCLLTVSFGVALPCLLPGAEAHVDPVASPGDPRQFYSFFNGNAATDVTLDGPISRGSSSTTEWDKAYVRNVTLSDFGSPASTKFLHMFIMNDDANLYIGVIYDGTSSSANDYVTFYFEEGNGTGQYDGPHDDRLTHLNENFIRAGGSTSLSKRYWDGYWNSTANAWSYDNDDSGQGKGFFDDEETGVSVEGPYYNREFRIPLNAKNDSAIESDLNVGGTDELGFMMDIYFQNEGKTYYWDQTGNDTKNVSRYADLQLGVPAKDRTMYATYARSGTPTVDGDITDDFGWADCYVRKLVLSNFQGGNLGATIYVSQDTSNYDIYMGMIIRDVAFNNSDYLRIYFDQCGTGDGSRNGVLDNVNPNYEQYFEIRGDGSYTDGRVDTTTDPATWKSDSPGDDVDGSGKVKFINNPGTDSDRYEFELLIPYNPSSPNLVDSDYDLNAGNHTLLGMLLRFYDGDSASGKRDYWWDRTINMDQVKVRENLGSIFIAPCWIYLQLGAPWLKLVSPVDGATVKGSNYLFRVGVDDEDSGVSDVNFAGFQISGESSWTSLIQNSGTLYWDTSWDTTYLADGIYSIIIAAKDNDGVSIRRTITVTVANGALSGTPPTGVAILSPTGGSTLSGQATIAASASGASSVSLYVDDVLTGSLRWNSGTSNWDAALDTTAFKDGRRTVKVTASNSAGSSSDAKLYTFDNWDLNTVIITAPAASATVTNAKLLNITVDFADDDSGERLLLYMDDAYLTTVYKEADLGGGNLGYRAQLNPMDFPDGNHTLRAVAQDPDGNTMADSLNLELSCLPSLVSNAPAPDSVVGGIVQLKVIATDSEGISSVEYAVDGGTVWTGMSSAGAGLYTANWDPVGLADGPHVLTFRAKDNPTDTSLRAQAERAVPVLVDNTPPSVPMIAAPMADSYVSGMSALRVLANDTYGVSNVSAVVTLASRAQFLIGRMAYNVASGYYEYDLDTVQFPDGATIINVSVTDLAGHTSRAEASFRIDNTAVSLSIASPGEGEFIEGTVTVSVVASDVHLADVGYCVDGLGWRNISENLDTKSIADGSHTIAVRARDAAGHVTVASVRVMVDNNAPTGDLVRPGHGAFLEGLMTVRALADDLVGIERVHLNIFSVFNGTYLRVDVVPMGGDGTPGCYMYELDTGSFPDGVYALNLTVTDTAGHVTSTAAVTVNLDNHAPGLSVTSPAGGSVLSGTVTVSAEASDEGDVFLHSVRYRAGKLGWTRMDVPWDTALEADGPHTIYVKAEDITGHVTEASVSVVVDNSLPLAELMAPVNLTVVEGVCTVTLKCTDLAGIQSVLLTFNGTPLCWENRDCIYSARLDTRSFPDGTHCLVALVKDLAGRQATASATLLVDNGPPSLRISSPQLNAYVNGSITIDAESADPFLKELRYRVDGLPWEDLSTTLDTRGLAPGLHVLCVRAVDRAGHETLKERTFIVDNSPPTCTVLLPPGGSPVSGVVEVMLSAGDDNGVVSMRIAAGNQTWQASHDASTGLWSAFLDTGRLPDGENVLSIETRDQSGRTTGGSHRLRVDNTGPSLSLRTQSALAGRTEVAFAISDASPLVKYEYRLDGGEWKELLPGKSDYMFRWSTGVADNGGHRVDVRATDSLGNSAQARYTVKVENPDYSWVVVLVVLLVAAGIASALLYRKRRSAPAGPEPLLGMNAADEEGGTRTVPQGIPDEEPKPVPEPENPKKKLDSTSADTEGAPQDTDQRGYRFKRE